MSSQYRIQHYQSTAIIPAGSGSITDIPVKDMNGLLRALIITPPASITGSSYSVAVGNQFSKASLAAGSTATIVADANNAPLQVPISTQANQPWLTIAAAGDTPAKGTLTDGNTTNVSNNDTVTIGSNIYTFVTTLTEAKATGTITDGNGTNVSDGDTVTVGTITYRFKTVPVQANDLFIGATADLSLTNLVDAINGTGTAGTNFFTGTQSQPLVTASAVTSHATTLTAASIGIAGNSIALSKTAVSLTLGGLSGGNLSGGANSVANQILIDSSADNSLTNLVNAINGSTGSGTKYSSATVMNNQVSAAAVASHASVITALTEVIGGDSIVTTTTSAHLTWGAATLVGSGEASNRTFGIEAYIER